jgi:SPP1 family predicted phage head-tail adaptor
VQAGKLRHRITIEQSTETQSVGEPVRAWSTVATVWANYEDLGGSEGQAVGQTQYAIGFRRYEIRFRPGLIPKMRVTHQSIAWDIERIVNIGGRDRELHLFCVGRSL